MRVLIVGAGGHAQVVADILWQMHKVDSSVCPIGYLDDNPTLNGISFLGLPVLGPLSRCADFAHEALVIAIGDNKIRSSLFDRFKTLGEPIITVIHPRAVIATEVSLGPGCMICAGAIINPGSVIGANVIINTGSSVDHHNQIGDHAHIAPGVHLGGNVKIGEGVLVGIGATVLPQRNIGAWSVVGAGAVVNHDVPDRVLVAGVPARFVRDWP